MTEGHIAAHPHGGEGGRTRRVTTDKSPREATVWIGYQDESKWYPFGSELAASRWALKGSKPRVQEMTLGKPPE